jgi:two-component system alkaline phosphatase synthesis response regulator PhoP
MTETPKTLLLIDDNPDLLAALIPPLRDLRGYQVISASDGISGLALCVELAPACVIIDIMMPGLDGYQVVRALRGDPMTAAIPLVILTALAQDRDQLVGMASGADQYLTKPVRLERLFAAIEQALALAQTERDERARRLAYGE